MLIFVSNIGWVLDMTAENQQINKIGQLLWSGNTAEAKRLIALESEKVESEVTDLKDTLAKREAYLATLHSLTPPTGDQVSGEEAGFGASQRADERKLTHAQKRLRKREILKAAAEISANGREFTSDDIKEILLKSDVVIGIPENRINTAIGAVLRRQKEDYERVAPGVYIGVKRDQPSQNGHGGLVQAEEASLG